MAHSAGNQTGEGAMVGLSPKLHVPLGSPTGTR
jgi:hypothetical protein